MPVWGGTVKPECHITVKMFYLRTTRSDDSGCTGNGKHSALWNVLVLGKSAGRSRNSGRTRSSDTTALYATDCRHVDPDFSNDNDRWKAVFDE